VKNIIVRLATEADIPKLSEYIRNTPNNLLDPDIVKYPTLRVLVVEADGEPIIFFPFHVVFQGESLAIKPGIDKKLLAYGFRKLDTACRALAKPYGIKEMFFQCFDESFTKFAERHGWVKVIHSYLRTKVQ
jgi:hypothetical protein